MSYCLNPTCLQPENPKHAGVCQTCNSRLLLCDRYRVLRILGQGRFGVTFLAQDESLLGKPNCAIKQFRPTATQSYNSDMARELFQREAEALGKLAHHPQVPQLLDYFQDAQQLYMVQEYIQGWTLHQEIEQLGPLPQAGVKEFLSEILPLLEFIHNRQIIHRDIKPANIMRDERDGKLVLIDFGAVKICQDDPDDSTDDSTWTDISVGTKGFAPPEQIERRPVYASDIYALGVTCIYLLTGKSPKKFPYSRSTCEMVWQEHVQVSDHFAKVLNKMLEAAVRYRYQSAREVLKAIDPEFDRD